MFRQYRSHAWQWHTSAFRPTCDLLDAVLIDKTVAKPAPSQLTSFSR
jgi:hypothetical protein